MHNRRRFTPLFCGLFLALYLSPGAAAAEPQREPAPVSGHLEQRDQPPAPPPTVFTGPVQRGRALIRGPYPSVQVNVNAAQQNIPGDAANEPSLAVSPIDPNQIVIGWRQFDSVFSNFREAGRAYTQDGGQTWDFPGVLDNNIFRSDPVIGVDHNGNFYYCSLNESFRCHVFKSANGGATWASPVSAYGGDKQWMAIDRSPTSVGRGHIYEVWQRYNNCCGNRTFTRSTNGGSSFMNPVAVSRNPTFGQVAVGPDGEVYLAGIDTGSGTQDFTRFVVAKSTNARNAGTTPTFTTVEVNLGGSMGFNIGPNPGGLLSQACIAVDHSSGATRGYVYLLCAVLTTTDSADVYIARSTNGGTSWGAPVRVNDDPLGNGAWQWFAALAIAPNGRLDVVFNDTRHDPTMLTSRLYYTYSTNGAQTWAANIPVSPPFQHFLGYPQQSKIGDYSDIVSDNAEARVAYAATFNLEQDVYFVRIGDCNQNGVHDRIDIAGGASADLNANHIPDECEDCNGNGIPDSLDIASGLSQDCNANGFPDSCDLADGVSADCNGNGVPDECDLAAGIAQDCDGNGVPDSCDIAGGSADCDLNGVPDDCEMADSNFDCNANRILDACEMDERPGLAGAYYDNANLSGAAQGRIDSQVNFDWAAGNPLPGVGTQDAFSVRWTGFVHTTGAAGAYTFYTRTDDGVRLWVNNELLIDHWTTQGATEYSAVIALDAGRAYPLRMEYFDAGGPAVAELSWQPPGAAKAVIPAANLSAGRDCNGNGRLDACDLAGRVEANSAALAPLGGAALTYVLPAPPDAVGSVLLAFDASGDLNFAAENVAVTLNGVALGTLYTGTVHDCTPVHEELTVGAAEFNAAKAGGNAVIVMTPSADVDPATCSGSFLRVRVTYDGVPATPDCNANGLPDACDIADGRSLDLNGNGRPDECDAHICVGDANCDGVVSWRDIDYFIAGLNDNQAGWAALFGGQQPACNFTNLDANIDGHVTWRDIDPFIARLNTSCR